ncbi:hypothetical protein TNCV_2366711 [Trichonephila clavipes]|nr:hypothetical protein TNCV_2366711 [Trichonephila clavipes]
MKTICENRQNSKNIIGCLTSAEGLASFKKRVATGGCKGYSEAKPSVEACASNYNASCIVLLAVLTFMVKIKNMNWCNVVALIHPGSMRNVSS